MTSFARDSIVNKPSLIEFKNLKFLIMDAPKPSNLHLYIKECKKYNVTTIVRISEPGYDKAEVEAAGIAVHVWIILTSFYDPFLTLWLFHYRNHIIPMVAAHLLKLSEGGSKSFGRLSIEPPMAKNLALRSIVSPALAGEWNCYFSSSYRLLIYVGMW